MSGDNASKVTRENPTDHTFAFFGCWNRDYCQDYKDNEQVIRIGCA